MDLAELLTRGEAFGDHWYIWYRRPGLWMTVVWGRPRPDEIEAIVALYDFALDPRMDPQYLSLVDTSQLVSVEPLSFAVLMRYLAAKRAQFQERLGRQAMVRGEGLPGAVMAGLQSLIQYAVPFQVFTSAGAALEWLIGPEGAAVQRELAERVERRRGQPDVVRAVRALLEGDPAMELGRAARSLGRSARALQHQLTQAGSSFRELRLAARMERAKRLLLDGDDKITAVALEVGCASPQHFARQFRAHAGMTPLEWRRLHRRD